MPLNSQNIRTHHSKKERLFVDAVRHFSRQCACTNLMLPLHLHGEMKRPSVTSPKHIRQPSASGAQPSASGASGSEGDTNRFCVTVVVQLDIDRCDSAEWLISCLGHPENFVCGITAPKKWVFPSYDGAPRRWNVPLSQVIKSRATPTLLQNRDP